jgi:hypothetical protein
MGIPKRKNNISVYGNKEKVRGQDVLDRRQELLDRITKSDSYLPDSILHDDLDMGMLEFVKENFKVVSDGEKIPVIPKILTIQRWGEFSNNWEFSDEDGNVKTPFIAIIRKPDVQPGTNPVTQRTIPDRRTFYYASVPNWDGSKMGADIYKIPQPVAVDITFDVTIVCNKFRDLNKFNKIILQKFSSRQSFTSVKGHYIPIILDKIEDNTPTETLDGRRFYIQNYVFIMLGILIDSDEFEVKPAMSRFLLLHEFIISDKIGKKTMRRGLFDTTIMTFTADGMQTQFSVGETMGILFSVTVNGLLQERDVNFFHISKTSKITFDTPPPAGSVIQINYYKGNNETLVDQFGKIFTVSTEYFTYTGQTIINVNDYVHDVISFDVNGLSEQEGIGFEVLGGTKIKLLFSPVFNSKIGITYLH